MKFKDIFRAMALTLLILFFGEIFSTSVMPALGLENFKLPFHILIVLFLAFRVHVSWYAYTVIIVEYFHSLFTAEGWAIGTLTGIIISVLVNYLKEMLDFSSFYLTIILVFIFQIAWALVATTILCFKIGDFSNLGQMVFYFIPGSLFLSILSPFLFSLLDRIWTFATESSEVSI